VIALRPEFPAAHHLLGNILLRKRDAPAALQEFREYLRLEPNGPFAPPTREVVAKIEQALATPR
jgi:lipoprotein NlpI